MIVEAFGRLRQLGSTLVRRAVRIKSHFRSWKTVNLANLEGCRDWPVLDTALAEYPNSGPDVGGDEAWPLVETP